MLSKTYFVVIFSVFNLGVVHLQDISDNSYMHDYDSDKGPMYEAFTSNGISNDIRSDNYTERFTEGDSEAVENKITEENSNVSKAITTPGNPFNCHSQFCKGHDKCIFSSGYEQFECICGEGFLGTRCELQDMCEIGKNGMLCGDGSCVYNENSTRKYCHCYSGMAWYPDEKECKKKEPPCLPNPCENGGGCEAFNDTYFKCVCKEGYSGNLCEVEDTCGIDENNRKCGLNGWCRLDRSAKKLQCHCYSGSYLDPLTNLCIRNLSYCPSYLCNENGNCNYTSDDGKFECICDEGFRGSRCDMPYMCEIGENGKPCDCVTNVDMPFRAFCYCSSSGMKWHPVEKKCKKNPCLPNSCNYAGVCIPVSDDLYNCTCLEGFTGEHCNLRDRCKLDGGASFCKGSPCIMDYDLDMFYCTCKDGEYFNYRQRRCEVVDFCPLMEMECGTNEICHKNVCVCKKGFRLDNETGECKADFCSVYGCPSGDMLCEESSTSRAEDFKCYCKKGFSFNGIKCVPAACFFPSLNECSQFSKCDEEAEEGYTCTCKEPFTLNADNRTCDYEYTSNETCIKRNCDPGDCIRNGNTEKCFCPPGYIHWYGSDYEICSGYDDFTGSCATRGVPSGVCPYEKCVQNSDIFRCVCDRKYELSRDKVTCIPRKICSPEEIGFKECQQKNSICIEDLKETKGYFCKCRPGFSKNKEGSCEKICNLPKNQQMCSMKAASCSVSDDYSLTCECPPGFEFEEETGSCIALAKSSYTLTLPISAKKYLPIRSSRSISSRKVNYDELQVDVIKSMKVLFQNFHTANVVSCKEMDDYFQCKTEVQFKKEELPNVPKGLNLELFCMYDESVSTTECLLPPSLILPKSEVGIPANISRTNFCDEDIKTQLCGPGTLCSSSSDGKGFSCKCQKGFVVSHLKYPTKDTETVIETCKDINECEEDNPCPRNSLCINTIGSYRCICKPGYKSNNYKYETKDQICSEICNPSPCIHGDCRRKGDHDFECRCQEGYAGILCNFEDKGKKSEKAAKKDVIIVGALLGGILLITVVLYVVTVMRLRQRKFQRNPNQTSEINERRKPGQMNVTNTAFEND